MAGCAGRPTFRLQETLGTCRGEADPADGLAVGVSFHVDMLPTVVSLGNKPSGQLSS